MYASAFRATFQAQLARSATILSLSISFSVKVRGFDRVNESIEIVGLIYTAGTG